MARLRATTGVGATASNWSYRATICNQSVCSNVASSSLRRDCRTGRAMRRGGGVSGGQVFLVTGDAGGGVGAPAKRRVLRCPPTPHPDFALLWASGIRHKVGQDQGLEEAAGRVLRSPPP